MVTRAGARGLARRVVVGLRSRHVPDAAHDRLVPTVKKCGAKTRAGGRCGNAAGWGTDHVGFGRCRKHGGNTYSGRSAAGREEVQSFMAAADPLIEADPIEALLYCVRRASAVAAYLRGRVARVEEGDQVQAGELNQWAALEQEALDRLARFSKMALDAGVAERAVRIAERVGATITQALEDALADVDLPPAERVRLADKFAARLRLLEAEPAPELEAAA